MKQALVERMKNTDVDEDYVTPTGAVAVLQAHILWLGCKRVIWEPCDQAGTSNITKEFTRAGHTVIATGIPEVDFLQQRKAPKGTGCIITNPPYSRKDEFLEHCFQLGVPFCLLLPLTSLEGVRRGDLFRKHGIQVLILNRRVQFMAGKSVYFNTSWFCWSPKSALLAHDLLFAELPESTRRKSEGDIDGQPEHERVCREV
jgi:hypothetical protein